MSETRNLPAPNLLDRIEVASPCTQDWSKMTGDEKRRFCGECRLHVHDLSAMTRDEAETLLRTAEERVCVRFYRRPDGRVLTKDCVTARDRIRRRVRRLQVAAAALFAFLAPLVGGCGGQPSSAGNGGIGPGVVEPPDDVPLMGDVCVPEDPEPLMGEVAVDPGETMGRVAPLPEPAKDDE